MGLSIGSEGVCESPTEPLLLSVPNGNSIVISHTMCGEFACIEECTMYVLMRHSIETMRVKFTLVGIIATSKSILYVAM
uniref:Uncharacterized protein n=1 Tax=Pseudoalteromonas luteoviolacea TaxID=43657 RepID=A0A023PZ88_9GAMM|nr:hypothetical protein [Pseudoalteromonas luteoviolacea]